MAAEFGDDLVLQRGKRQLFDAKLVRVFQILLKLCGD